MAGDPTAREQIELNVRKYRRAHRRYEAKHPEIFNPIEQARLRAGLAEAIAAIDSGRRPPVALDLGCGSGNLTRHLLELGCDVVAADVSPDFLRQVEARFGDTGSLRTLRLNGEDLDGFADGAVDLVCAYSVLHHIPDYLRAVDEAARVVRPGGVLYLDHEANDNFYDHSSCFWDLMRATQERRIEEAGWWCPEAKRWQRFLQPSKYYARARRVFDPAYPWNVEGDIHVWWNDRIEWDLVEERLAAGECAVIRRSDYLNYSSDYPDDLWERFRDRCTNMRLVIARREPGA